MVYDIVVCSYYIIIDTSKIIPYPWAFIGDVSSSNTLYQTIRINRYISCNSIIIWTVRKSIILFRKYMLIWPFILRLYHAHFWERFIKFYFLVFSHKIII